MKTKFFINPLAEAFSCSRSAESVKRTLPSLTRNFFNFSFLVALLCGAQQGVAATRSDEILGKMAAAFRSMPAYNVTFGVTAGNYSSQGRYSVEGESYYMTMGDMDVYCDGATRYEVDNRRHEVTITGVDKNTRNILNNPVRAFEFLGDEYKSSLVWERDGRAAVLLTPSSANASAQGSITVTVDTSTMRPVSLVYDYDGERITVTIKEISSLAGQIRRFDKTAFAGYEFIDFR